MDLSVIIVSYNARDYLEKCLASVFAQTEGIACEVIVVDNASADGSRQMVLEKYPRAKCPRLSWIDAGANLGFARANNIGLRQAQGEFLLLLNPDTEVMDGALQKMVAFMRADQTVGLAGCRLVDAEGKVQRSVRAFPTLWNVFCEATFLYALFPRTRLFGRYYMTCFDLGSSAPVDWVSGAFLMIRRSVFEAVGLLDEEFFMYSEEMDYCRRAADAGFQTWFCASATVLHHWGGMAEVSRRSLVWTHGSQLIYFRKHFRGFSRCAIVAVKLFGVYLRALVYTLVSLLPGKRAYREKARCYMAACRELLRPTWRYRADGAPSTAWSY